MKNLKKVLSVLLVVAMLAATMVPAFAAETATVSADAKICADIGMLIGEGDGVTADYTKTAPTRIQAAIMLLRLKGLAADAAKFEGKENFADVKGDEWFAPYTAYLKANPSVGFVGVEDGKFAAELVITAQEYYKVVLTALGYEVGEGKDYKYDDTFKFAAEKGLKLVADVTSYTVNDLAIATVEALKATVKGGTKTLTAKLVEDDKALDEAKATAAGIYTKPVVGAITAKVVGAKKFDVAFNKAIDPEKIKVTVKKGTASYTVDTVTPAADKKSVVVAIANPIVKGEYTISVEGVETEAISAKVTTEDERITKIEFLSENAVLENEKQYDAVSVAYKVLNQYNEDITDKKWSNIAFYGSKGDLSITSGKVVLTTTGNDFVIGEKLTVTANYVDTDNATSVFASQVFTVSLMASVAKINVVELYNADGEELDITSSYPDFKLIVEAKDQYGNDIPYGNLASGLIIQSTNEDVVKVRTNFEQITVNGVKKTALSLDYPKSTDSDGDYRAGSANIMFVSKALAATATFTVTVKDDVMVDTITLQSPDYAVAGEKVKIPFTAIDQFGNEITTLTPFEDDMLKVSDSTLDLYFDIDAVSGKPVLILDAESLTEKKIVYITGTTDTYKFVNFSVSLQAPAKFESITGIASGFLTNVFEGDTSVFDYFDATIVDTYGRTVSRSDAINTRYGFGTKYRIYATSSNPDKVGFKNASGSVTEAVYVVTATDDAVLYGVADGSSTVKLVLQEKYTENSVDKWKDISDFTFSAATVNKEDVKSYEATTVESFHAIANAYATTSKSHRTEIAVTGILGNGKKVNIPYSASNYAITVSGPLGVEYSGVDSYVYSTDASIDTDESKAATYTVTVFGENKPENILKTTKVSGEEVYAKTLSLYETYDAIGRADSAGNKVLSLWKESANVYSVAVGDVNNEATAKAAAIRAIKSVDQYGKAMTVDYIKNNATVIISSVKDEDGEATTNTTYLAGYQYTATVIIDGQVLAFTMKIVK